MGYKFLFGALIFIIMASSIGSLANIPHGISNFESNDMVASETGIDIFKLSNVNDITIDIILEKVITNFDIAIVDTDYIYADLYAISNEYLIDPIQNPHLLSISSTVSQFDTISYDSKLETVYLLVYSIDVLNGELSDLNYILSTNIDWEIIDPSMELENQVTDTIYENGNEYLDANEYKMYELDIPANQIVDIYVEITDETQIGSTLIVILFDGNSGQDLIDAFMELDEALVSGDEIPESIYRYGIVFSEGSSDIFSYFPFVSDEAISLRLGIMSVNTNNPNSMNIIIESSIVTLDFEEGIVPDYTSFDIVGIVGAIIVVIVGFFLIRASKKRRDDMITKADNGEIYSPALIPASASTQHQSPRAYPLPSNQYRGAQTPPPQNQSSDVPSKHESDDAHVNFCPNCGSEQINLVKFCSKCGEQLR